MSASVRSVTAQLRFKCTAHHIVALMCHLSSLMLFVHLMVEAVRGICAVWPYGRYAEMSGYTQGNEEMMTLCSVLEI